MTLDDMISVCRTRTADAVAPYLWSDVEWTMFLNEAENEAAERAQLLLDTSTAACCRISVVANTATYNLHASILKVQRAKLTLGTRPLAETSIEQLDSESNWEAGTGTPARFFQTSDTKITLVPIPTAADTLNMRVYRLPLVPMETGIDEPEIAAKHHYRMLDWALRCAYLKQDAETLDKGKAAEYESAFIASFGVKPDANVQRKRRDRRPPVVQMGAW